MLFSVRDRKGAYVRNLTKSDFEIREDGRRQEIRHFACEIDSPMTLALLLDVSGSVANIIGTEKEAAARFFSEVLRPSDKALLAGFAELIAVWQESYFNVRIWRLRPIGLDRSRCAQIRAVNTAVEAVISSSAGEGGDRADLRHTSAQADLAELLQRNSSTPDPF